jgi:hypothetical protein
MPTEEIYPSRIGMEEEEYAYEEEEEDDERPIGSRPVHLLPVMKHQGAGKKHRDHQLIMKCLVGYSGS